MLKDPKHPIILTTQDYIELFSIPEEQKNNTASLERLERWIKQATDQFDSLVSAGNDAGSLFRWWNNLKDNQDDNEKGYKLQKAIGSWVETYIQTGKFWTDGTPAINSNFNVELNASSDNSSVETKRLDIIQDLVSIGLYRTSNMSVNKRPEELTDAEFDDYVIISKKYLEDNFLKLNPQTRGMQGPLNFNNKNIEDVGNISSSYPSGNRTELRNFNLINCVLDGSIDADRIWDPKSLQYVVINALPISTWNGLTQKEIIDLVNFVALQIGVEYSLTTPYVEGASTFILTEKDGKTYRQNFISKIDNNLGNQPIASTTDAFWIYITGADVPLGEIIDAIKPIIEEEIAKYFDALDKVDIGYGLKIDETTDILSISDAFKKMVEDNAFDIIALGKEKASLIKENTFNERNRFNKDVRIDGDFVFAGLNFSLGLKKISDLIAGVLDGDAVNVKQLKDAIADIIFDTTNLAKLNEINTFNGDNYFNDKVFINGGAVLSGTSTYNKIATTPDELVNKEYLDIVIAGLPTGGDVSQVGDNTMTGSNIYNGVTQFNGRVLIAITPTTDFEPVNKIFGDTNYAKVGSSNTFTETNTFELQQIFKASISMLFSRIVNVGDPIDNDDGVNKRYVVTNFAGLNTFNTFADRNRFNGETRFDGAVTIAGDTTLLSTPTEEFNITNKKYVDTKKPNIDYVENNSVWNGDTKNGKKIKRYIGEGSIATFDLNYQVPNLTDIQQVLSGGFNRKRLSDGFWFSLPFYGNSSLFLTDGTNGKLYFGSGPTTPSDFTNSKFYELVVDYVSTETATLKEIKEFNKKKVGK